MSTNDLTPAEATEKVLREELNGKTFDARTVARAIKDNPDTAGLYADFSEEEIFRLFDFSGIIDAYHSLQEVAKLVVEEFELERS